MGQGIISSFAGAIAADIWENNSYQDYEYYVTCIRDTSLCCIKQ
jgi:hypothetical protein